MQPGYSEVLIWAVFLLLGYWGFGNLLVRSINRAEFNELGWASKVALGMCFSIFLGSTLMVFKLATAVGLVSIAVFGFCLAAYYMGQEFFKPSPVVRKKRGSKQGREEKIDFSWIYLSIPAAFALLTFATSVYWPFQYDPNDDWVAYLTFPERILQTGTLIEPFSQRRIFSLCGQSILLAQIMVVAAPESAHLLDRGFGALIFFGLLVEATPRMASRWNWLRILVIFTGVCASVPRINTSSTLFGVCLMFAFLLNMSRFLKSTDSGWRDCMIPGILLAGAASLRFTYSLFCVGALTMLFIFSLVGNPVKCWRERFIPFLRAGICCLMILIPLMWLSLESSGTPIYPPFRGNLSSDNQFFTSKLGIWDDLRITADFFLMPEVLALTSCIVGAAFLSGISFQLAFSGAVAALGLSCLVGLNSTGTAATWNMDFYRLSYPLLAAGFFWILTRLLEKVKTDPSFSIPHLACMGMIAALWYAQFPQAAEELKIQAQLLAHSPKEFRFESHALQNYYKELQNKVPPGEKIFAIVDAPYLLDYARNPIGNVDNISCASPPPGMPFHKGPAALKEYLNSQGYKYIIAVDFNKAVFLYNMNVMSYHPRPEFREFSKKYIVDFLSNINEIAAKQSSLYNANARIVFIGENQIKDAFQ